MVKAFLHKEGKGPFASNTYVIGKIGGSCLVIDPGTEDDNLVHYIQKHYEKVSGILLTHGHFDHIRAVEFLKKKFRDQDVPVFLHPLDKDLLGDPEANSSAMVGESLRVNFETTDVQDGEILPLRSFQVQVIHTPFHTRGSVCYLFEDDNALFTGDTLFQGSIGRHDMVTSEPDRIDESLKKILALKPTLVVYPGHGCMTTLLKEKEHNPFLQGID